MNTNKHSSHTNQLINESSPYLLQHANNPVEWHPWGDVAINKAKSENKLLIISIGYSACHWCHVMEKESFVDESIADLMNRYYVPVKVDREEHPEVDQTYMNAIHLLSGRGGWPLNVFALPDGRPFWGGTYFNKEQWRAILERVHEIYRDKPEDLEDQAAKVEEGIRQNNIIHPVEETTEFHFEQAEKMVQKLSRDFDRERGGMAGSPKFPLPVSYQFLLHYSFHKPDEDILNFIQTSLRNMAYGGIYDQLGGGFARYTVDEAWRVPHFEKMLYDNGQLISLYAQAYKHFKDPLYERVINESIGFIEREMMSEEGAFYSALDADSEGEEGKYYVWTKEEIDKLLGDYSPLFKKYYNIEGLGYWENGKNILIRTLDDETFARKNNLSHEEWIALLNRLKRDMLNARETRVRPGLDDKILASWNGLMLKGLVDAYKALGREEHLNLALKNAEFIAEKFIRPEGGMFHTYKNGKAKINGFLEDYAFVTEAFINLYEVNLQKKWLDKAHELMKYALEHFYDNYAGLFFFTSDKDKQVISRSFEIMDNVIPASNSSIMRSLYYLGWFYDKNDYIEKAETALHNMLERMSLYPSAFANWGKLLLHFTGEFRVVAVAGKHALEKTAELHRAYLPGKILLGHEEEPVLPHLENRFTGKQTMIYVCTAKACRQPVEEVQDAIDQLKG